METLTPTEQTPNEPPPVERVAVVLFNLGGPDGQETIAPFLKNFFNDPNIIRLPAFMRRFIAARIAAKRSRKEAGTSYAALGNVSPLLANTQGQARALEAALESRADGKIYKTFIAMRYWHPFAIEAARDVKNWAPDHIVLLPLYPQYSTTTTRSSFQSWEAACDEIDLLCATAPICCWPFLDAFIEQSAQNIAQAYRAMVRDGYTPRLLLSAHGLPESVIRDGDPYQWQCEESARRIADRVAGLLGEAPDWQICYQSRVGPMKWIGPSTEEALEKAAADEKAVLIYPHAFVSEHVETLVEIGEEYRDLAKEIGIPAFGRVDTVMTGESFIEGLAEMVSRESYRTWAAPDTGRRLCPKEFCRCPID